jgi:uncharacterized protein YgiM (DUF1202 family)
MGLFDNVNSTVAAQQQQNDYNTALISAGVTVQDLRAQNDAGILTIFGNVTDQATAEKAVTALKTQPGVKDVVNLLEIEDLTAKNVKMKIATQQSNLNIRKGPGTEYDIVGKAAHGTSVQLIKRMFNNWYYIKTDSGIEGFCAANFLEEVK